MPTMLVVSFDQGDSFRIAQSFVKTFRASKGVPCPFNIKEVTCGTADQDGCWRAHHEVIGVIHAKRQLGVNVLFGVLRTNGVEEF